jgi:CDP-glycerol glycerophosphotransferase (TagB/SpsB family)
VKLLRNLVKPILWLLGWLIPKRRDLVLFGQWGGRYADNSRALFEWMTQHSDLQVIWLYSSQLPPAVPEAIASKVRMVKRESLYAGWLALRARVVVISHGHSDFGLWRHAIQRARSLMLWHAIMVKSAFLTDGSLSASRKRRYRRREARHLDAVIASSDIDRYHTVAYMGVPADRVYVTGLPRQDAVFRAMQSRTSTANDGKVKVLYAPTHRDTASKRQQSLFFPFTDKDEAELAVFCQANNIELLMRPHPNDKASRAHVYELAAKYPDVFVPATPKEVMDVAQLLPQIQVLVTDYSSIYLDLLPFDIPCVFLPFDIEEYSAHRGLAYYYDLITPGPKVYTQADFTMAMSEAITGAADWHDRRDMVSRMFFAHLDAAACERTSRLVDYLVSGTHRRPAIREAIEAASVTTE